MRYEIRPTVPFVQQVKRLKKKYRHIDEDLNRLKSVLQDNPRAGEAIPGFEGRIFKVRMASSDMKRGKRGGFRIVYYLVTKKGLIYLLAIYAKARREDIRPNEIQRILNELDV